MEYTKREDKHPLAQITVIKFCQINFLINVSRSIVQRIGIYKYLQYLLFIINNTCIVIALLIMFLLFNFLAVLKVHMVFLSNMKEVSDGSWDSSDTCVSPMHYQDT